MPRAPARGAPLHSKLIDEKDNSRAKELEIIGSIFLVGCNTNKLKMISSLAGSLAHAVGQGNGVGLLSRK